MVSQLPGPLLFNISPTGKYALRIGLKNPAAFSRTLAKLSGLARGLGTGVIRRRGALYVLVQPNGSRIAYGVLGGAFVVANEPARARLVARQSPAAVPGANGSLVLNADAQKFADAVISRLARRVGVLGLFGPRLFTAPLGDLTGSLNSSTSGLKGTLSLKVH